jgi:golgin subfamily B member 1
MSKKQKRDNQRPVHKENRKRSSGKKPKADASIVSEKVEESRVDPDLDAIIDAAAWKQCLDSGAHSGLIDLFTEGLSRGQVTGAEIDLFLPFLTEALQKLEAEKSEVHRARQLLRQISAHYPSNSALLKIRAEFFVGHGDYEAALVEYGRMFDTLGGAAEKAAIAELRGDILANQLDRVHDAILQYQTALRCDPQRITAIDKAILIYMDQDREEQAKQLVDAKLKLLGESHASVSKESIVESYLSIGTRLRFFPMMRHVALSAAQNVLELDNENQAAKALLEEIESVPETWKTIVRQLRNEALDMREKRMAARQYLAISQLWSEHAPQETQQIDDNMKRCLMLVPGYRPALRFLEERYRSGGRINEFITFLRDSVKKVMATDVAVEMRLYMTILMTETGADDDALILEYQAILKLQPRHVSSISALTELYMRHQQFQEAAKVMETFLKETSDIGAKESTMRSLARLYEIELEDAAQAAVWLERYYEIRHDEDALFRLKDVYEKQDESRKLAETIEKIITQWANMKRQRDAAEKTRLLEQLFGLWGNTIGEPQKAFKVGCALYLEEPRESIEEELTRLADVLGKWTSLGDTFLSLMQRNDQGSESQMIRRKAAHAFIQANDGAKAHSLLEQLLKEDPNDPEVLSLLDRLLQKTSDPVEVALILERQADVVEDPQQQIKIRLALADAHEKVGDREKAVEQLQKVLVLDSQHQDVLERLDQIFLVEERFSELSDVIETRLSLLGPPDSSKLARELFRRLARIYDERLGLGEKASAIYIKLFHCFPDDLDTVRALERIVDRGIEVVEIADALQSYYAQAGIWKRYVEMLGYRRDAESESDKRATLSAEIAKVKEEKLSDPADSFKDWGEALLARPQSSDYATALTRIGQEHGFQTILAELFEKASKQLPDGVAKNALISRRAELLQGAIGDEEAAIEAHKSLLEQTPSHIPSIDSLIELFEKRERWAELREMLHRRISMADEADLPRLGARLGMMLMEKLGDSDAAEEYLLLASKDPGKLPSELESRVLLMLAKAYRTDREQRGEDLVAVLQKISATQSGSDKASSLAEMASVCLNPLGDGARALAAYSDSLKYDGTNPDAIDGLNQITQSASVATEIRSAAAKPLLNYLREQNDTEGQLAVLGVQLTYVEDLEDRRRIVQERATILLEETGAPEDCVREVLRYLVDDPHAAKLRERAEQLSHPAGCLNELLETFAQIRDSSDPEIAKLYATQLVDIGDRYGVLKTVVENLQFLLKIDPSHVQNWEQLRAYSDRMNDAKLELECLRQLAELTSGSAKVSRLQVLADFAFEILEDVDVGLAALREVCDIEPDNMEAYLALQTRLEEYEQYKELIEVLHQRAEIAPTKIQMAELFLEQALVYRQRFQDTEQAVTSLSKALELDPEGSRALDTIQELHKLASEHVEVREEALSAIIEHHRKLSDWQQLVECLELRASHQEEGPSRAKTYDEINRLQEKYIRVPELAFRTACMAFRDEPNSGRLDRVTALADMTGAFADLLVVIEDVAKAVAEIDSNQALALYRAMIEVIEKHLDDRSGLVRASEAILVISPKDSQALKLLEQIHRAEDDDENLIRVLQKRVETSDSEEDRTAALMEMGSLHIQKERFTDAESCLRQAMFLDSSNKSVLIALQSLYAQIGNAASQVEILRKRIEGVESEEETINLQVEIGLLLLTQKDDPAAAAAELTKALDAKPDADVVRSGLENLVGYARTHGAPPVPYAAFLLERCLRAQEDWVAIPPTIELRLVGETKSVVRASLLGEMAEIQLEKLQEPLMAFMTLCRAIKETPADNEMRLKVETLAQTTENEESLMVVYEDILESVSEREVQIELNSKIAEIAERVHGDKDVARTRLELAIKDGANDIEILKRFVRLKRDSDDNEGYRDGLSRLSQSAVLEGDFDLAKEIFAELAEVEETAGNVQVAIGASLELLQLDSKDQEAKTVLERLYRKADDWVNVDKLIAEQLAGDSLPLAQAEPLLIRLIDLRLNQTANFGGAVDIIEHWAEAADQTNLENLGEYAAIVFDELNDADLGGQNELRLRVALVLEPILKSRKDWAGLSRVYRTRLDSETDVAERKTWWNLLAALENRELGQPGKAMLTLGQALKENPADIEIRKSLNSIAKAMGDFDTLVSLYEIIYEEFDELEPLKAEYAYACAQICENGLRDIEGAASYLAGGLPALEASQNTKQMDEWYRRLDDMYRKLDRPEALAPILTKRGERAIADENAAEAQRLLLDSAGLYVDSLGDSKNASAVLAMIVEHFPENAQALEMLLSETEKQGQWPEFAEAIEKLLALSEGSGTNEVLDLRFRWAVALDLHLFQAEKATEILESILEAAPQHDKTRDYLQNRMSGDSLVRKRTAAFLGESYQRTGDWSQALELMQEQLSDSESKGDKEESLKLSLQIAQVQETNLDLPDMAFMSLCRGLSFGPSDTEIHKRLVSLAISNDCVEELVEVYEDEATRSEVSGNNDVAIGLRERGAQLLAENLDEPARAIDAYELVLEKKAGRVETLDALIPLYENQARWDNLENTLRQRLMFLEDGEERAPYLMRLCRILVEELSRSDEALALINELDAPEEDTEARSLLIQINEAPGREKELCELLKKEMEAQRASSETGTFQVVRKQLALLLSEEIEDYEAAIPVWEEIYSDDSEDALAFGMIEELYNKTEEWAKLRDHLEKALDGEKDPARISQLTQKLGRVLAEKLGGAQEAVAHHVKVLELRPKNMDSLNALRGLHRSLGNWAELVTLLRKMMRFASEPTDIKELRFDLASVLGAEMGKRAEAVETARRVLAIEPHSVEELARLADIFQDNQAWPEACQVYNALAERAEGQEQIDSLLKVATILEDKVSQPEAAAEAYEKILAEEPLHPIAYKNILGIYEDTKSWQALVHLLERKLPHVAESNEKCELLRRIGQIYDENLQQKEMAFLAVCRAYKENYYDAAVAEWMDKLAIETDAAEELMFIYDDALGFVDNEEMIVTLHFRMAELARDQTNEMDVAETHFHRILEYDATLADALDGLIDLYVRSQDWSKAGDIFRQKAEIAEDKEEKINVLRAQARMFDGDAHDPDAALVSLRGILEIDEGNAVTLQSIGDILEREERWEALIDILEIQEGCAPNHEDQVSIRYRIGGIWEQEIQNADKAILTYQAVLDEVPDHQLALKALERLYSALDRPRDLIDVYEQMAREASEKDEKIRFLGKVAQTWEERFEGVEEAVLANDRILEIDDENLEVIRDQQRLLRQRAKWDRLIEFLKKDAALTDDSLERANAYLAVGQIFDKELSDMNAAEDFYNQSLEAEDNHLPALHALGDLFERSGNWFNALEKMSLAADLAETPDVSVELYYRIGKINEDMLLDLDNATRAFSEALDVDDHHVPSIRALKDIALQNKSYEDYVNWFRQEIDSTKDESTVTELHAELGLFLQDHFMDLESAAQEFEKALALDYAHLNAAMPLAYICFRQEAWERAENLLDIIVDRIDAESDPDELCRQLYRLGYVCEKLDKTQKALKNYQRSYDIDSTFLPAMEGLGTALNRAERWQDASQIFQAILEHHSDGLTDAEIVDYHQQLGLLHFNLGETASAQSQLEKALKIDPAHRESLRMLSEVYESAQDFEEAYEILLRRVPLEKAENRIQLLIQIGRLSKGELEDPYRAIDAYEDANRQTPGNREVLDALLPLYRQTKQASRAVEVIEEIVRIEVDEQARVRFNFSLGEIYRDELKNPGRAIQFFNAGLDLDPTFIKAFEAIEAMLSQSKDWKGLEENYVAMIRRIPEQKGVFKNVLWKNLGNLYRFKLKDLNSAIQAFTVLYKSDPRNPETLEILGGLLSRNSASRDEAIKYYQKLVQLDEKSRIDVLHTLLSLYLDRKKADRAFLVTAALNLTGNLQPEEQKLYEHYKSQAPRKAKRAMTPELWDSHLCHPGARGPVAEVATCIYRVARGTLTQTPKHFGLEKKREWAKLNFETPVPDFFLSQVKYVREVLGITGFDVFVKKGSPLPVQPLNIPAPALGVGQQNEVFREMRPADLWFIAGLQIAYLKPAFFLAKVLGAPRMQACMEAAITMFEPGFPVRSEPQIVAEYQKVLRRFAPELSQGIQPLLKKLRGRSPDTTLQYFFHGVEYTANRTGLLLCGEISAAGKMLRIERPGVMRIDFAKKMNDLLEFSVSNAHCELREKLQIAVGRAG